MVVPVKFVVSCAAADDIFVIATIPDGLPEDAEFTRVYYLCAETEDVWHCRDWPKILRHLISLANLHVRS